MCVCVCARACACVCVEHGGTEATPAPASAAPLHLQSGNVRAHGHHLYSCRCVCARVRESIVKVAEERESIWGEEGHTHTHAHTRREEVLCTGSTKCLGPFPTTHACAVGTSPRMIFSFAQGQTSTQIRGFACRNSPRDSWSYDQMLCGETETPHSTRNVLNTAIACGLPALDLGSYVTPGFSDQNVPIFRVSFEILEVAGQMQYTVFSTVANDSTDLSRFFTTRTYGANRTGQSKRKFAIQTLSCLPLKVESSRTVALSTDSLSANSTYANLREWLVG